MARLSACIIVRDDRDRLARAIGSVRQIADEIVVTDTGSTDGSDELARSLGARVTSFAWCDDFAAAYNHCIDHAAGDWILSLDSDEWLDDGSAELVRIAMSREDAIGHEVVRRDLLSVDGPEPFSEIWQLRLFRRRGDTRYVGRIHHQFRPALEDLGAAEGRRVVRSQIRLLHSGYAGRDWAAKCRRDAELMELELRDRPGQFYYLVQLGIVLLRTGQSRGYAVLGQAAEQAADDALRPTLSRAAFVELLEWVIAAPELPAGFAIDRATAERWAEGSFLDCPALVWQLARRSFESGAFERAASLLERLVEMGRTGEYSRLHGFDPRIIGAEAVLNLGACRVRLGELDAAEACFASLVARGEQVEAARQNLEAVRRLRG